MSQEEKDAYARRHTDTVERELSVALDSVFGEARAHDPTSAIGEHLLGRTARAGAPLMASEAEALFHRIDAEESGYISLGAWLHAFESFAERERDGIAAVARA